MEQEQKINWCVVIYLILITVFIFFGQFWPCVAVVFIEAALSVFDKAYQEPEAPDLDPIWNEVNSVRELILEQKAKTDSLETKLAMALGIKGK